MALLDFSLYSSSLSTFKYRYLVNVCLALKNMFYSRLFNLFASFKSKTEVEIYI